MRVLRWFAKDLRLVALLAALVYFTANVVAFGPNATMGEVQDWYVSQSMTAEYMFVRMIGPLLLVVRPRAAAAYLAGSAGVVALLVEPLPWIVAFGIVTATIAWAPLPRRRYL